MAGHEGRPPATTASPLRVLLFLNSLGFGLISFASYFDVYSHRFIFVGVDPWYNPAHLMLYGGVSILLVATLWGRSRRAAPTGLALVGILTILGAAAFNEFWHRVLLFGNPVPEPFSIEPPHALLAVGFAVCGFAALRYPLGRAIHWDTKLTLAVSITSGSLWAIVAGSFFYLGATYPGFPAYFLSVLFATFSSALFLRYPSRVSARFGAASASYFWFLFQNYVFFVRLADGLPFGIALVVGVDFLLSRTKNRISPVLAAGALAALYGVVYSPLLPPETTISLNPYLIASFLGVAFEAALERTVTTLHLRTDKEANQISIRSTE